VSIVEDTNYLMYLAMKLWNIVDSAKRGHRITDLSRVVNYMVVVARN